MDRHTTGRDRSLITNPNLPAPTQHHSPTQTLPKPFAQQPPYEHRDSFPRDPFHPQPAHVADQRNDASDHQYRDTLQPAPPPPPSPFHSRPVSVFSNHDHPRRGSIAGSVNNLPDPHNTSASPSFHNRHMLPPLSPRRSPATLTNPRPYLPTPPPPSISTSRDNNTGHRHGNMSISSIMGSDAPAQQPQWSPFTPGARETHESTRPAYIPPRDTSSRNYHSAGHSPPARSTLNNILRPFASSSYASSDPPRPSSQPTEYSSQAPRYAPHRSERDEVPVGLARPALDEHNRHDFALDHHVARIPQYAPRPTSPPRQTYDRPQSPRWLSSLNNRRSHDVPEPDRALPSREGGEAQGLMYGKPLDAWPLQKPKAYGPAPQPDHYGVSADNRRYDRLNGLPASYDEPTWQNPQLDAHLRRSLEESQMSHRSILAAQESARRVERASPLPQAVQGASTQPLGPGRNPSIKNEFGSIFSGLGSGVGSTPQPLQRHSNASPTTRGPTYENGEGENGRSSAREMQRRLFGKREYDEAMRVDSDSGDEQNMPMSTSKSGRRSKPIPHHHHVNTPHHHHLHPRNLEDDSSQPRQLSATPFSSLKSNAGSQSTNGTGAHHHHRTLPPHHHHRTPLANLRQDIVPATIQVEPLRRPQTIVLTNALLDEVSHLKRGHLGSQLYNPKIVMPCRSTRFTAESKFPFATEPNLIPRFEGKENCTYTIRVPREHLSQHNREHICAERQVWGTDVYTDDSDPVAAAIHSGWILGAWDESIDRNLLLQQFCKPDHSELHPKKVEVTNPKDESSMVVLTEIPVSGPMMPPPDRDLHIDILILPPLLKYGGATVHGMRSRSWGSNHDGMSFKVVKISWVNEGQVGRYTERGAAVRKRIKTMPPTVLSCGDQRLNRENGRSRTRIGRHLNRSL